MDIQLEERHAPLNVSQFDREVNFFDSLRSWWHHPLQDPLSRFARLSFPLRLAAARQV